ncbi:MAG: hypothetical protein U0Q12_03070 [Vicinamibacterales bacterium]
MSTYATRVIGALALDSRIFEEVEAEHERHATGGDAPSSWPGASPQASGSTVGQMRSPGPASSSASSLH